MAGKDSIKTVKTLVAVLVTVWIVVCAQAQTLSLSRVSRLIFDGEPNRIYEIQYSTDLNSPNWQTLGSVKGDDFGKTVVIDDSQGSRFYRTMLGNFLSVTLDASPANGVALAAGEGGEVAVYTLLAGASDMNVARLTLEFDSRLWLYADAVRLVDLDSNTFLGSRENLNAADFAELTVGARYSLDFPLAFTVPGGTRRRVAVIPHMRAVSDRPLGIVGIIRAETRATDAVGVSHTDSTDKDRFFIYKGGEVEPGVISGLSASVGAAVISNNEVVAYPVSFTFTLTAGNDTLYMAERPSFLVSQSVGGVFETQPLVANPGSIAGDRAGDHFVVPAGSSRTFILPGVIRRGESSGNVGVSIGGVPFGTDSSDLSRHYISYGLEALQVNVSFTPPVTGGNGSSGGTVVTPGVGTSGSGI